MLNENDKSLVLEKPTNALISALEKLYKAQSYLEKLEKDANIIKARKDLEAAEELVASSRLYLQDQMKERKVNFYSYQDIFNLDMMYTFKLKIRKNWEIDKKLLKRNNPKLYKQFIIKNYFDSAKFKREVLTSVKKPYLVATKENVTGLDINHLEIKERNQVHET